MVVTRSNYHLESELSPRITSESSRIGKPRAKSKSKAKSSASSVERASDLSPFDHRIDPRLAPSTADVTFVPVHNHDPILPSHSTGIVIPAQSPGTDDQDYERQPQDQQVGTNDLRDRSILVQEQAPQAQDSSVHDHHVQPDKYDHLRNDQSLIRDTSLPVESMVDPLREDLHPLSDQHLRAGNSNPLRKDYPVIPMDQVLQMRYDSLRRSNRSTLSEPSPQHEDLHPLRKDLPSPVSCPSQAELISLRKRGLSLPIPHLRAQGPDDIHKERLPLIPEHSLQQDLHGNGPVHLPHDQRQLQQQHYIPNNDIIINNPRRGDNKPDQRFYTTPDYPYGTSSSSGNDQLHPAQYRQFVQRSRPISTRPPESREPMRLVHPNAEVRPANQADRTSIDGSSDCPRYPFSTRPFESQEVRQHPLRPQMTSSDCQEHRLRQSILSSLRASDNILYNDVYLETIIRDRELLSIILYDEHLRRVFLSHPRIIEKSVSDPTFLHIEHNTSPKQDYQHYQQYLPNDTVINTNVVTSTTQQMQHPQRAQQSTRVVDNIPINAVNVEYRPPVGQQLETNRPSEVISISSFTKRGSNNREDHVQRQHGCDQPPRRDTTTTRRKRRDPSGSPSDSSSSSDIGRDSHRSRRAPRRRRTSHRSSSSSSRSSSATGYGQSRPYPNLRSLPGVTSGRLYRPPNLFGNIAYDRCPGCKHSTCRHKISDKDFQGATNTAKSLGIKNHYQGADDRRSGAAWIQEIFKRTIGQRNVVRYTFARLNTVSTVWSDLTRDDPEPVLCYQDYDRHWELLLNRINELYSDQEILLKLQNDFNHLQQESKETVTQFISKLDSCANQLCLLGITILDDVIKRRLYDGLLSDRLRDKMDRDVDDHRVDYTEFKRLLIKYDRRRQGRLSKKETDPATVRLYGGRHPDQRRHATVSNITNNGLSDAESDGYPSTTRSSTDDEIYYVYAVARDQQSITCYRCLQDGHPARDCTNEIGKKGDRCLRCGNPTHTIEKCNISTSVKCHRCGRDGHLAYVCPDPMPSGSINRNKNIKGKGKAPSKGKGRSTSTAQATSTSTTDTTSAQASTPSTPNVKISGVDPGEIYDDTSDTNQEETDYNENQSNMITTHHNCTSTISIKSNSAPNDKLKKDDTKANHDLQEIITTRSTPKVCSSSTSSTRCDIVVGIIQIGPETRPVLFDTGADISLIAIGTLKKIFGNNCPSFSTKTKSNVKVANASSMEIIGHVGIPIKTKHIMINERFAVTDNSLSSPVILGCPALQQLQCAIVFTSTGPVVFTGIENMTSSFHSQIYKTISKSAKYRQPKKNRDQEMSITHQPMTHIIRLMPDNHSTSTCSVVIGPNNATTHLDILHGDIWNGKIINKDNCNPNLNCAIPDTIACDPYSFTDLTEDKQGESHVTSDATDYLPPWKVIQRRWISDFSAPLGRCQLSVPWLSDHRPDHNFRIAARRGAASVQRLSSEEKQLFHQSLQTFIDRKYCGIVQDNSIGNYQIPPSSDRCQAIWRDLHEGTSMANTIAPKPIHYTPSHAVFRKDHCTTPCRIVLDYRVLNRFSHRGGSTQHNLVGTLLSVRSMEFMISADISKAFCEMFADPTDIPFIGYTCIGNFTVLWNRVSFGSTCAPAMLETDLNDMSDEIHNIVLLAKHQDLSRPSTSTVPGWNLTTDDLKKILLCPTNDNVEWIRFGPQIPTSISMVWFVDDVYIGGSSKTHTIDCYSFAAHIYEGHHKLFDPNKNFTSWKIASEQHSDQPETLRKLLGYLFRRSSDLLHAVYEASPVPTNGLMTKRKASSYLLSLYDPLGIILEQTMIGRLIWRKITEITKDWDANISGEHQQQVSEWVNNSIKICNDIAYGVPRFTNTNDNPVVLSVDASIIAWGIDLRCLSSPNDRLMSRAGLFPKNQMKWSIPRKELESLWKGLKWIKMFSIYLPVKTNLAAHQQPLHPLRPDPKPQRLLVITDSEINVYRLRRSSNDKRLPSVERRRLTEIRQLCVDLDAIVYHVPSEVNPADSLSRAKPGIYCYNDKIKNAIKTATVIYDHRDSLEEFPTTYPTTLDLPPDEFVATTVTINPDGIPLPDLSTIGDLEQRAELERILDYAKHQYTTDDNPILDTIEFTDAIESCAKRSQLLDEDLRFLKLYLEGNISISEMGSRATYVTRLATICDLDDKKIIRRRLQESEWKRVHEHSDGVIFLGGSNYANKLMTILAIIFHYVYAHRAHRKITGQLQRRYNGKRLPIIVKNTIKSCIPCLRSKAHRGLNYVSRSVQALATRSIWQVCGADIVGPYQRDEPEEGSTKVLSRKRYILLVHDAITSFTCARILYDASSISVADAFHSIWCEMGAPSVLITDKDLSGFINRHVKKNLISHGIRHLVLPPYSPHLSFWERIHRDFVQMSRSINCQVNSENDYIKSYLLAIRAFNCTAKGWIPFTPASLHFTYHQRLPGDPPASNDTINYDALSAGTFDSDNFGFARAMLPFVKEIQEEVSSSINEYIEYWYHKQAEYRKKINLSTETTYPNPKPFDLVFITNYSDIGWSIGNKMQSKWEGPYTIAKVPTSSTILVAPELILPNRKIWERSSTPSSSSSTDNSTTKILDDHNYDASSIDQLFKDHELQLVSLKNVVHAKAFEDLVRDQHLRGQRIYIDHRGAIKSIDSRCNEAQDLQRIRELRTEGAIKEALDNWRRSTTSSSDDNPQPQDQDLSAEDSTEEARPSTITQQADHPPDEQGDTDTSQDPEIPDPDVPQDENLPSNHTTDNQDLDIEPIDDTARSINPRPSRRHRRAKGKGKGKAKNRNDPAPTDIKITRPLPTNLTDLRRHLPRANQLKTGCILSIFPPDGSVMVSISSSKSNRGVGIIAFSDMYEGRVYLRSINDDQSILRKCFISDLVYICGSTTVMTRQHRSFIKELHLNLGIDAPFN